MILKIKINKEDFVACVEEYFFQYEIRDREGLLDYCTSGIQEILEKEKYSIVNEKELISIALEFLQETINKRFEQFKKDIEEE